MRVVIREGHTTWSRSREAGDRGGLGWFATFDNVLRPCAVGALLEGATALMAEAGRRDGGATAR